MSQIQLPSPANAIQVAHAPREQFLRDQAPPEIHGGDRTRADGGDSVAFEGDQKKDDFNGACLKIHKRDLVTPPVQDQSDDNIPDPPPLARYHFI